MEMLQIILYTLLMFFVIVTVHEWGHYFFAKRAGILVREFAIGFGPKVFSIKSKETLFTFRLLPLGGYARMAGEDPEMNIIQRGQTIAIRLHNDSVSKIFVDRLQERKNTIQGEIDEIDLEKDLYIKLNIDERIESYQVNPDAIIISKNEEIQIAPLDRQYKSKSVGQRLITIFAGPLMNFLLAFFLFGLHVFLVGIPVENPQHVTISQLTEGMPAAEAKLQKGDIVESINGIPIGGDYSKMVDMITNSKDKQMDWVVQRDGQSFEIEITPRAMEGQVGGKVGIIPEVEARSATALEIVSGAYNNTVDISKAIVNALGSILTGGFSLDNFAGPVGTFELTGQVAKSGFNQMVFWTAMISLNLGIFNLLPIPALDGSRLVFLGVEWLRGKPVDPNREGMVHFIGFAMLFLLMIAVTYNDILRLING